MLHSNVKLTKVRFGSSYITTVTATMLSRIKLDRLSCRVCFKKPEVDSLWVGKRRGNQNAAYYCISCALNIHIITLKDLKKAIKIMGVDYVPQIMAVAVDA